VSAARGTATFEARVKLEQLFETCRSRLDNSRSLVVFESDLSKEEFPLVGLEFTIEEFEDWVATQRRQGRGRSVEKQVSNLHETLHDLAGLALLFGNRGRHAVGVGEPIAMMVETELSNRAVVDDAAVAENVVAIPIEPAEDVLIFECSRDTREIERDAFCQITDLRFFTHHLGLHPPSRAIDRREFLDLRNRAHIGEGLRRCGGVVVRRSEMVAKDSERHGR